MRRNRFQPYILENVTITNAGSEGKSVARQGDKVVLVDYAVPGDVVDIMVTSTKKKVNFGKVQRIITPSPNRIEPFCSHFGICGGDRKSVV